MCGTEAKIQKTPRVTTIIHLKQCRWSYVPPICDHHRYEELDCVYLNGKSLAILLITFTITATPLTLPLLHLPSHREGYCHFAYKAEKQRHMAFALHLPYFHLNGRYTNNACNPFSFSRAHASTRSVQRLCQSTRLMARTGYLQRGSSTLSLDIGTKSP